MNEQSKAFVRKIEPHASSKNSFDIFKPVTLCALDIICETAMGKAIHAIDDENSEYVSAIYRYKVELLFRFTETDIDTFAINFPGDEPISGWAGTYNSCGAQSESWLGFSQR